MGSHNMLLSLFIFILCYISLSFSAALEYSLRATSTDAVVEFSVRNPTASPVRILKRLTPLEGIVSDCMAIRGRDGAKIPYTGIYALRVEVPIPEEYMVLGAYTTFTTAIDISTGYNSVKAKTGDYSVRVNAYIKHYESHESASNARAASEEEVGEEVSVSTEITIHSATAAPMANEKRFSDAYNATNLREPRAATNRPGAPLAPTLNGFTAAQRAEIVRSHDTATVFLWSSVQLSQHYASSTSANQQYINYFGAITSSRYTAVTNKLIKMYNALRNTVIVYNEDPCTGKGWIAYTYGGANGQPVFLCPLFFDNSVVPFSSSTQNRFMVLIHELSHGWVEAADTPYGVAAAKQTALNNPDEAIASANCIGYYAAMSFPLDWGFDTIATIPSGTYATIGPIYFKYKTDLSGIEAGYPRTINGNWGNIPSTFGRAFDSMITISGKTYVSKDSQYIRYSDAAASVVDSGYPRSIQGNWGNTPAAFNQGFHTMGYLHNNLLYIFKGNQYLRSSDGGATIDVGYPKPLSDWNSFSRFDAIFRTNVGGTYTYIISGKQYARCSDATCSTIDHVLNLRGNWGRMPYYS